MLDKSSPIPLYYQLVEAIKEQISSNAWPPGAQIPGEREMSEQYCISRMTVRQALQHLIREGLLVTKHGLGTFVAEPKMSYDPLHLIGFTEDMLRRGATATSQVLEQAVVMPSPSICEQLQLAPGETTTKISRLRLSDDTPLILETVYVPTAVFPGLERENMVIHSLYQLLFERFSIQLKGSQQTVEATLINAHESQLFGAPLGLPMILIEGVTYDVNERPIEYFKAVYRGDRFKIHLDSRQHTQQFSTRQNPLLSVVMR